jgi:hypothetical protein
MQPLFLSFNRQMQQQNASIALFLNLIELFAQDLVHCEHMHLVLLENRMHSLVAANLTLVFRDLQVPLFDILPDLLDHLWPRELRPLISTLTCTRHGRYTYRGLADQFRKRCAQVVLLVESTLPLLPLLHLAITVQLEVAVVFGTDFINALLFRCLLLDWSSFLRGASPSWSRQAI